MPTDPTGFTRSSAHRECACIGIFGPEGSGKTRLAATATEWAAARGTVPGWIVCDRKTRKTLREVCAELGVEHPYTNDKDFITQAQALELASQESLEVVKKTYSEAIKRLIDAAVRLGAQPNIEPIVFDSGTQLWDWIAFSHFGRKQDVGKSRVWGPPKQDWTDLMDALQHKTVLVTLRAKDEYRNDARTGTLTWDGAPHLGYTTTTIVRCSYDRDRKLKANETFQDRFTLDVVESQDNVGLAGVQAVLAGDGITFGNLMANLRPEE